MRGRPRKTLQEKLSSELSSILRKPKRKKYEFFRMLSLIKTLGYNVEDFRQYFSFDENMKYELLNRFEMRNGCVYGYQGNVVKSV